MSTDRFAVRDGGPYLTPQMSRSATGPPGPDLYACELAQEMAGRRIGGAIAPMALSGERHIRDSSRALLLSAGCAASLAGWLRSTGILRGTTAVKGRISSRERARDRSGGWDRGRGGPLG